MTHGGEEEKDERKQVKGHINFRVCMHFPSHRCDVARFMCFGAAAEIEHRYREGISIHVNARERFGSLFF